VDHPPFNDVHPSNFVTSLSFSSEDGGRSILAVGRQSGQLSLWGICESEVRFELGHPNSISCVAFKPRTTERLSERFTNLKIEAEEIAVGDDVGSIWYYSVEWPENKNKRSWNGSITLLAKISAHTQQVCGLAWSPDERFLATGGNDNACLLFELTDILPPPPLLEYSPLPVVPNGSEALGIRAFPRLSLTNTPRQFFNRRHIISHLLPPWVHPSPLRPTAAVPLLSLTGTLISGSGRTVLISYDRQKHRLPHAAAVKAIAFAPWQPSLLATGGGSNDRAIHFFHARTGVCLATINVFAQVTSLIWSQTRREIAATFGYTQPDHPFRIAVFAWPSCAQIAIIPWGPSGSSWDGPDHDLNLDCGRALWAVSYPGRPPRPPIPTRDESDLFCASARSTPVPRTRSQSPERASEVGHPRPSVRLVRPKEKEGGMWCLRTMEEGCIIVASSDQTVKFHEIWTGRRRSPSSASGLLGGSDILEGMEGIEKSSSEVIR
jgi:WD40 repeat protein